MRLRRLGIFAALCVFASLLAIAAEKGRKGSATIMVEDVGKWTVELFCGNPRNRHFIQGPRTEGGAVGNVVFDSAGNAYMACGTFIQFVDEKSGTARVLAGAPGIGGSTDGPPWKASFMGAFVLAMPDENTIYVVDGIGFTQRKLKRHDDGTWHTETVAGQAGVRGHKDGPGREALFTTPFEGIAVGKDGVVYLMDGNWLRKFENGIVTTLNAGSGRDDGPLADAKFLRAMGQYICLAMDKDGNLFVADRWNMAVRKVDMKTQTVSTVAGCLPGAPRGAPRDGPALQGRFHSGGGPCGIVYNAKYDYLLIKSADERGIRRLKDGWLKTFGFTGRGRKAAYTGPLANAFGARLLGVDHQGNVYVGTYGGADCMRVAKRAGGKTDE